MDHSSGGLGREDEGSISQLFLAASCVPDAPRTHSTRAGSGLLAMKVSVNAHVPQDMLCYLFMGHDDDACHHDSEQRDLPIPPGS